MKKNHQLEGTPNSPVLIFSNSLGSDMCMWDELLPHLLPYFRILRYNTRGHGRNNQWLENQPHTIEAIGQDVIDLMDQLNIAEAFFCGLSMGGLVGLWLGINHPNRFKKIVLSNTSAKIGTEAHWDERIDIIKNQGFNGIIEGTLERWFSDNFRKNSPEIVAKTKNMFLKNNAEGYINCCEILRNTDFRPLLPKMQVPTLVITGHEDPVTNVEQAEYLVANIPNSQLIILKARHLSSTELPVEYSNVLINFLIGNSTYDHGMHIRRTVLGDTYVDQSNTKLNILNADFQSFITNYAWGEIWARPNLSKHNRSIITIAMLIALNRAAELKMHIRAAFNNGVSVDELKEIIMHSALYCGLPAANEAMHLAVDELRILGKI